MEPRLPQKYDVSSLSKWTMVQFVTVEQFYDGSHHNDVKISFIWTVITFE